MKIVTSIQDIPSTEKPIALSIGVFDGIHLGHQALIKELHKLTRKGGTKALVTFSNHPSTYLRPNQPTPLLMSLKQRLHLLKKYGIDLVIALPFNREIAHQSYGDFLEALYEKLPFKDLVVGEGTTFGHQREGTEDTVTAWGQKRGFDTHYLKKELYHKEIISSGTIRTLVSEGNLKKIKKFLGRRYSLWSGFEESLLVTLNEALFSYVFDFTSIHPLPSGVYGIDFEGEDETLPAIAFLRRHAEKSSFSVNVFLEKEPEHTSFVNLSFVEFLHSELDPGLLPAPETSILKALSPQPSLS